MKIKPLVYRTLTSRPLTSLSDLIARRAFGGRIPNGGCRIDTNAPGIDAWVRTLILWNLYETAELRMIRRYLPADLDVIELGGSIGVVGSQIARRMAPGRQLISVEANPGLIDVLRRNIQANGPRIRDRVVHGAIAYDTGGADRIEICMGDTTLTAWRPQPGERRIPHQVPVVTLSGLLAEAGIGPFALVADIEGAEAGLLLNEREALARCALMILELHETTYQGRRLAIPDLVRMATDLGFVVKDQHRTVYALVRAPEEAGTTGEAEAAVAGMDREHLASAR